MPLPCVTSGSPHSVTVYKTDTVRSSNKRPQNRLTETISVLHTANMNQVLQPFLLTTAANVDQRKDVAVYRPGSKVTVEKFHRMTH